MLLVKEVTVNFIKRNICGLQILLCDYNILYYLCDLEKVILYSFLNELDSYNFMNAADKGHHAVRTAHASSGKKYCLVALIYVLFSFIHLSGYSHIQFVS